MPWNPTSRHRIVTYKGTETPTKLEQVTIFDDEGIFVGLVLDEDQVLADEITKTICDLINQDEFYIVPTEDGELCLYGRTSSSSIVTGDILMNDDGLFKIDKIYDEEEV